jgi:endogenous inhibitor of DNA gyrase (YacG/DUF329 family)
MIRVRCPICQHLLPTQTTQEWPQFPFCSPKCKLIDLGRWLGEEYRIESDHSDTDQPAPETLTLKEEPP